MERIDAFDSVTSGVATKPIARVLEIATLQ
jgi:hypothetical protein